MNSDGVLEVRPARGILGSVEAVTVPDDASDLEGGGSV